VERLSKIWHAVTFLTVLIFFTYFIFRSDAFNYARVWWWTFLSLVAVFWGGLLATIDLHTAEHFVFVVLLFVGWAVIVIIGVIV
jgi:hypothetical protein